MKKYYAIPVLCILLFGLAEIGAQQAHVNLDWAPQQIGDGFTPFMARAISPEVHDNHTVTFQLKAPDVQEVLLSGSILLALGLDWEKPVPFIKGEEGLWTLTVGPLDPEIYYYKLMIDGVAVVDPSNTLVGFANQPGFSIVVVHGDGPAYYDAREVPHGNITRHIYHSDVLNGEREIFVYTPPGYDPYESYPVLYLLGGSGELASTWSMFGRVNFIEDNLIAEGKALPMIIAIPNNQVIHRRDPNHTPRSFELFEEEMLKVVIPLLDENYSTMTTKHGRAIAGLSMGGRHAQIIGLNNLDVFGSIGMLSAAESLDLNPGVFEDPDLNNKIDYLFVGAGTKETRPASRHVVFHEELEKRNVEHVYYIGSEGAHDFVTWRHLLYYQFLPNLWRTN
jgi:enterochelin esterase-like enzyme